MRTVAQYRSTCAILRCADTAMPLRDARAAVPQLMRDDNAMMLLAIARVSGNTHRLA
jgi:hypothetical protein